MTTNNPATQNQDTATEAQTIRMVDVKNAGLGALVHTLYGVSNTARAFEHTTGVLADKAENYRKQVAIADAIEHNELMAKYVKQANDAGIDISNLAV